MIKEQLNILILLAYSDGKISEREAKLIKMIGVTQGIAKEEIEEMLKKPPESIGELGILTNDQKFDYLYQVVQMMKIDGKVYKSEIEFCKKIASRLGYKKDVIAELSANIFSDPYITSDRDRLKKKVQKYML